MGSPTRTHGTFPGTTTFQWSTSASVASVWAAYLVVTAPELPSDWDAVALSVTKLPANSFAVPHPADGELTLVQIEPRYHNYAPGLVKRITIPATPQLPAIELDDHQTVDYDLGIGTQWWKITERGIAVTSVQVLTQIGAAAPSAWGAPTRAPGAASTVRGGVLGAGEYEHDVALDRAPSHSWIMPRLNLANGVVKVLGPFNFATDAFKFTTTGAALASYAANTITVSWTDNGGLPPFGNYELWGDDSDGAGFRLLAQPGWGTVSSTYISAHNLDAAGASRTFNFYLRAVPQFARTVLGQSGVFSVSILSL